MPSADYYRRQAQLFAKLALAVTDRTITTRYNLMALEHLARAEEVEPDAGEDHPYTLPGNGGSDMDRD